MMRRARTRTLTFGSAKPEEDKRLELKLEGTAMTKSWDGSSTSRPGISCLLGWFLPFRTKTTTMAPPTQPPGGNRARQRREFVHPDAEHGKKKYDSISIASNYDGNNQYRSLQADMTAARQEQAKTLRHRTHIGLLLLPRSEPDRRIVLANSRLRRGLQLLGADALPEPWLRSSDVGVLSRLCHPELALCRSACCGRQYTQTPAPVNQGNVARRPEMLSLHDLTVYVHRSASSTSCAMCWPSSALSARR